MAIDQCVVDGVRYIEQMKEISLGQASKEREGRAIVKGVREGAEGAKQCGRWGLLKGGEGRFLLDVLCR